MSRNPSIVAREPGQYIIRFTRKSWRVLNWVHDLTGRKMKDLAVVSRPLVFFATREEAEQEVKDVVIPYLLKEKGVEADDLTGW